MLDTCDGEGTTELEVRDCEEGEGVGEGDCTVSEGVGVEPRDGREDEELTATIVTVIVDVEFVRLNEMVSLDVARITDDDVDMMFVSFGEGETTVEDTVELF